RRSVALGFRLEGYQILQRAAFDVLDMLADAVILLDRRSKIVFANRAGRALDADGCLRLRQSIVIASQAHSQRLAELLHAAVESSTNGAMSISANSDGRQLTVLVFPLRSKDLDRLADAHLKDASI